MIFNRRRVSAIGPLDHTPLPSGPRSSMVAPIRATAPTSGSSPVLNSPANPHTLASLSDHAQLPAPPKRADPFEGLQTKRFA
jgi:hypothetical protein